MKLCVKIGGAQLEQPVARAALGTAVAAAREASHDVVIVHGGGNQIRILGKRLGIPDRYHDGLRITDAATADMVLQVLAGEVNKTLVQSLAGAGVRAVGLCGADGGASFTARRLRAEHVDLGYVGALHHVDRSLCDALVAAGFVPVLATVAPLDPREDGPRDRFYNVNADHAAAPLARALECDAMLFLTDVAGVLDESGNRLAALTPADCARLRANEVIRGGMIPKVDAALAALADLPDGLVKIAPAAGEDAVLRALHGDVGTRFVPDPA